MDGRFQRHDTGTIGVPGTSFVMATPLDGQVRAANSVLPERDLDEVATACRLRAVAGACTPERRALFFEAGPAMVAHQGAKAVLLAGTDLRPAFDGQDPGLPSVDAVDIDVEALAAAAGIVPDYPSEKMQVS